jgi:deoxyribodipyrimidine photo-lyase
MLRLLVPSLLSPRTRTITMAKRARPHSTSPVPGGAAAEPNTKKPRTDEAKAVHKKIATAEAAARVDAAPPFKLLKDALMAGPSKIRKGDAIVYWHRMEDLRST